MGTDSLPSQGVDKACQFSPSPGVAIQSDPETISVSVQASLYPLANANKEAQTDFEWDHLSILQADPLDFEMQEARQRLADEEEAAFSALKAQITRPIAGAPPHAFGGIYSDGLTGVADVGIVVATRFPGLDSSNSLFPNAIWYHNGAIRDDAGCAVGTSIASGPDWRKMQEVKGKIRAKWNALPGGMAVELHPAIMREHTPKSKHIYFVRQAAVGLEPGCTETGCYNPAELQGFATDHQFWALKPIGAPITLTDGYHKDSYWCFRLVPVGTRKGYNVWFSEPVRQPVFRPVPLPTTETVKAPTLEARYKLCYYAYRQYVTQELQALMSTAQAEEFSTDARSGLEPRDVAAGLQRMGAKLRAAYPQTLPIRA